MTISTSDKAKITLNATQSDFLDLTNKLVKCMERVRCSFNQYEKYCEQENFSLSDSIRVIVDQNLSLAKNILSEAQKKLDQQMVSVQGLIQVESEIRVLIQLLAMTNLCCNWRTPSSSQVSLPSFFRIDERQSREVPYERWGHVPIENLERKMLKLVGLNDSQYSCTLTNSGMAALSLIECMLTKVALKPGDTILLGPDIYFEFRDSLRKIDWLRVVVSTTYDSCQLIDLIEETSAKVVFLDVLSNTVNQRIIDIECILNYFNDYRDCPYFVVDGTMLPLGGRYIKQFSKKDRIFYVESCSKYLQMGLDITLAGFIISSCTHDVNLKLFRRHMGVILTEFSTEFFPDYTASIIINRIIRIERNASLLANSLQQKLSSHARVIFPGLVTHSDFYKSKNMNRMGGCVVCEFDIFGAKDRRAELASIVDTIMKTAKNDNFPLAEGLSFGFTFPRITASIPVDQESEATHENKGYLRLYVGSCESLWEPFSQIIHSCFIKLGMLDND